MTIVSPPESLLALSARKKFGRASELGFGAYGLMGYGSEFIGLVRQPYGVPEYGILNFGDYFQMSGIYQQRELLDGQGTIRMVFYVPSNPETIPQEANREKFAAAILAWQGLTIEQKRIYNELAVGQSRSGYNIYISEYMLS